MNPITPYKPYEPYEPYNPYEPYEPRARCGCHGLQEPGPSNPYTQEGFRV